MAIIEIEGRKFEVDEEGFLRNPEEWNDEVAVLLAKADNIQEMSEEHWAVVKYIRQYYLENQLAPMVRSLCKATDLKLRKIYELFPLGPAKGACKVAGLPKPDGCV
ncbi:TusE/DsrC/DsvC family sulfur relay protein [candidate division TA06 bacterium]|uniref:TusE/DsrC/DsvC family sulfur relay protein n=1 Tax=candidate division TA06 bacterium TaxID=2250710 RepID=A0A523XM45_UNCT6|nr:MAG: TusE/DsrC/DsvC family sulfur relay protein [candidate division TA06 bacterium]